MKKLITFVLCLISIPVFAQTWTNPMTLEGEWIQYGIGDPYILKYRGTYYLYCSTRDSETGIKCWSSKDLVNWSNAIMCSNDPITRGAYAPEVVYWNGMFYMYTSPAGNGHYVLESTSPTGPFVRTTGNFGKSIDGSVFIEDDGKWYFYHAGGGGGIQGCTMSSPTSVGDGRDMNVSIMGDWTEGSTVIKRNGVYYIIYTGNHVISKGYRIDYAKNTTGPISSYTPQARQNPILLNTEGAHVGLGHGSAFIGPDLDSYYYTYHNLAGDFGVGPYRRLNYDRMAWNGDKMVILGATTWAQQAPEMADFADFFERTDIGEEWTLSGGNWGITDNDFLYQDVSDETEYKAISNATTGNKYTAEFTIKEVQRGDDDAKLGAIFGYSDESNYGTALFLSHTNQLEVRFQVNGTWSDATLVSLPSGYKYTEWHSVRIEKWNGNYKFFVDGMLKANLTSELESGKIGYITSKSHGNFGYIAFSNKVNGTGIFDIYKPIPGTIEAVHYNSGGEGVGYHDLTSGNSGGKYIREDNVDIRDCSEGGHTITAIQPGEWYKYNVNVESQGTYTAGIRYASANEVSLRIWADDEDLTGVVTLPSTGRSNNTWRTFTIRELNLKQGYSTLKIEAVSGEFDLYKIQFNTAENEIITKEDTFDDGAFNSEWNYSDGAWKIESGQANIDGFGKRTMGDTGWSDYTVQTDVTYINSMNGGLIFRVKNPALGGAGNNPQAGTDYYQGYFVTLGNNAVVLGKQNYSWTQLRTASGSYVTNRKYTLRVVVTGDNIKVFVDDMETPVINYTDPDPFINGKVGLRVHNANISFDNFIVSTTDNAPTQMITPTSNVSGVEIYPNPVNEQLSINNISGFSGLSIFGADGRQVYNSILNGENNKTLNVSKYDNGFYFLKLTSNDNGTVATIKFIKN